MLNPSNPLEWILTILLFVISLGVLITLHELGHLTVAKIFKVYCQEFSIGFGPAILHVRGKGKETYFSIRAIPLGGYVSMYGEDVQLEDGLEIPRTRSLDGINRWKKAAIMVAGITMNLILAISLFFVSNVFFPVRKATIEMNVAQDSYAASIGLVSDDKLAFIAPANASSQSFEYRYKTNKGTVMGYYLILDDEVFINDKTYVATYYPLGSKADTTFSDAIRFYEATDYETAKDFSETFIEWHDELEFALEHYPNVTKDPVSPQNDMTVTFDLAFHKHLDSGEYSLDTTITQVTLTSVPVAGSNVNKWADIGLSLKARSFWLPFGTRIKNVFIDFGNASIAIFQGFAALFTDGLLNLSGIVGIFTMSASVFSSYGIATYFYFWGLISVNLAIFNLLPFPGLDGWQLLVTAIEGSVNVVKRSKYKKSLKTIPEGEEAPAYQEWKIPMKVKNIMSYVGLGILLVLGVTIIVLDILKLFVL